ncbi:MAG: hypothetical protein JWO02_1837 [Solirubrobacterales bacterium]|nr:hypothetical protein [Solirubrobacterales bacterium]
MRIVIDGLPIRGMSVAVVVEHLLHGWMQLDTDDELHLVLGPDAELVVPPGVTVHRVDIGRRHYLGRLRAQATVVPRLCRDLSADVMLGVLPSTTINPLRCPRAVIAWDLRHELRPAQFGARARLLRRVSYNIGFRQADAIVTISERTRDDLLASRPWLAKRIVRAAQLGGDHVDTWPAPRPEPRYAITFGQWGNKNVDLVIDAWAALHARGEALPLTVVGLGEQPRRELQLRLEALGLDELVRPLPWLSDTEFRERFTSAAIVVFPSDFEGFGLPAVEAMRLGIPVVVTPEPALLEVTGGRAVVMRGWDADALVDAVLAASRLSPERLAAAQEHASGFTWARTAEHTRSALAEAIGAGHGAAGGG